MVTLCLLAVAGAVPYPFASPEKSCNLVRYIVLLYSLATQSGTNSSPTFQLVLVQLLNPLHPLRSLATSSGTNSSPTFQLVLVQLLNPFHLLRSFATQSGTHSSAAFQMGLVLFLNPLHPLGSLATQSVTYCSATFYMRLVQFLNPLHLLRSLVTQSLVRYTQFCNLLKVVFRYKHSTVYLQPCQIKVALHVVWNTYIFAALSNTP